MSKTYFIDHLTGEVVELLENLKGEKIENKLREENIPDHVQKIIKDKKVKNGSN